MKVRQNTDSCDLHVKNFAIELRRGGKKLQKNSAKSKYSSKNGKKKKSNLKIKHTSNPSKPSKPKFKLKVKLSNHELQFCQCFQSIVEQQKCWTQIYTTCIHFTNISMKSEIQ